MVRNEKCYFLSCCWFLVGLLEHAPEDTNITTELLRLYVIAIFDFLMWCLCFKKLTMLNQFLDLSLRKKVTCNWIFSSLLKASDPTSFLERKKIHFGCFRRHCNFSVVKINIGCHTGSCPFFLAVWFAPWFQLLKWGVLRLQRTNLLACWRPSSGRTTRRGSMPTPSGRTSTHRSSPGDHRAH